MAVHLSNSQRESMIPPGQQLKDFAELRRRAASLGRKRVGVVVADDDVALTAAQDALDLGIAIPILIGDAPANRAKADSLGLSRLLAQAQWVATDQAAATAARLANEGQVDVLLKGHLRTDELLRAILDKTAGLRTGRLLSDVLLYEDRNGPQPRLVGITDGGLNVLPNLDQKRQIIQNAIELLHRLGWKCPKIAVMSATEIASDSIPSSVDARLLSEMAERGEFGDAEVFGPLALDCALVESAARAKGIYHPVAGRADCLVMPNIEAGNLLGKSAKYLGGSQCAHLVVGAKVPILIPSRVESVDDKVNSIALGVIFAAR
jgi:phosphate butyryltransferase